MIRIKLIHNSLVNSTVAVLLKKINFFLNISKYQNSETMGTLLISFVPVEDRKERLSPGPTGQPRVLQHPPNFWLLSSKGKESKRRVEQPVRRVGM